MLSWEESDLPLSCAEAWDDQGQHHAGRLLSLPLVSCLFFQRDLEKGVWLLPALSSLSLSVHLYSWSSHTVPWAPEGPGLPAPDIFLQNRRAGLCECFPTQTPTSLYLGTPGWGPSQAGLAQMPHCLPAPGGPFGHISHMGKLRLGQAGPPGHKVRKQWSWIESQCVHLTSQSPSHQYCATLGCCCAHAGGRLGPERDPRPAG